MKNCERLPVEKMFLFKTCGQQFLSLLGKAWSTKKLVLAIVFTYYFTIEYLLASNKITNIFISYICYDRFLLK